MINVYHITFSNFQFNVTNIIGEEVEEVEVEAEVKEGEVEQIMGEDQIWNAIGSAV